MDKQNAPTPDSATIIPEAQSMTEMDATPEEASGFDKPLNSTDDIMSALQDSDRRDEATQQEPKEARKNEAPENTQEGEEAEQPEEVQPAVEAPASWGKDSKEIFSTLPRPLQEQITRREAERERFVGQKAEEATKYRDTVNYVLQNSQQDIQRALQATQAVIEAEFAGVDWTTLQINNPAHYQELSQMRQRRLQDFQRVQQTAQEAAAREAQIRQAEAAQKLKSDIEATIPKIRDVIGEDFTPQVFAGEAAQYLLSMGVPEKQVKNINNGYVLELTAKAMKYDQMQKAAESARKKVAEAPKVMKQKSSQQTDPAKAQRDTAYKNFKRNPKDINALAAYLDTVPY